MELVGLEPTTSWVRIQPLGIRFKRLVTRFPAEPLTRPNIFPNTVRDVL
jgi:hypothetical protein